MKKFILKNKKIACAGLLVLSVLFLILAITNLSSTKRDAYQSMYDANNELYETYIDAAEKFEQYGYSSKSQSYYSKAYALDDKLERYKSELTSLNVQLGLYVILSVTAMVGTVYLFKIKANLNVSAEIKNDSNTIEGDWLWKEFFIL